MEAEENNRKTIVIPILLSKKGSNHETRKSAEKQKKTRVLVENLVLIQDADYNPEKQWGLMFSGNSTTEHEEFLRTTIKRHIAMKLHSYKTQDLKNAILDLEQFVDLEFVMELLKISEMRCFYCRELVQLLYRHVREPRQWTLERIDNDLGHNRGNVEIACLGCNLRRRCMHHERYVFTKQMRIVKTDGDGSDIV